MGDIKVVDMMIGVFNDLFGIGYMGIMVENVVDKYDIVCDC